MSTKYYHVGQIIRSKGTIIRISILGDPVDLLGFEVEAVDAPFDRYLQVGKTYTCTKLHGYEEEEIWSVPGEQMLHQGSQVLLYADVRIAPNLDLDS